MKKIDFVSLTSAKKQQLWNMAYTNMIRRSTQTLWGNWDLNPAIKPGAVGILNPTTGTFSKITDIPSFDIEDYELGSSWAVESTTVKHTQTDVSFKGGYKDPTTGSTVTAGLDLGWVFDEEGSLSSSGTVSGRQVLKDLYGVLDQNYKFLKSAARSAGKADSNGIMQGFGIVTEVINCSGIANLGSESASNSFSLTGSIDGTQTMTGTGGQADASLQGSYKTTSQTGSFNKHLFPAVASKAAKGSVAAAYQFASFDGKSVMPTWIGPISDFQLVFDNSNGGTYIGRVTVSYKDSAGLQQRKVSVPGGQTRTIAGIPLEADNLKIEVDFMAGDTFYFHWRQPRSEWLTPQRTLDLSGVWPWGSKAELRPVKIG